jgi:anti-sigma B factor antagonist
MSSTTDPSSVAGLEVTVTDQGTTRTITVAGEIDLTSIEAVRAPLSAALSDHIETVVLDLEQTTFIDSSGVALMVATLKRTQSGVVRFVVLPSPSVTRVFDLSGLADALRSVASTPLVGHDGAGGGSA